MENRPLPTRAASSAPALSDSIVSLLRLQPPSSSDVPVEAIDAALKLRECGGYLHGLWRSAGLLGNLPPAWIDALARAHRKTLLDNLAALAEFRDLGRRLVEAEVPFILLKGSAYLADLYEDPGGRMMTDIDLLVRRDDLRRLTRGLAGAGYETLISDMESRRFELVARGRDGCRFEVHWWLGLPFRDRIPQEEIWRRAAPAVLEGVACRRLAPEDAILYHAAHQADHYFGPSLKWVIDLREMLRRWAPDHDRLLARAADWRLRVALGLALRHLDKLFPGDAPRPLLDGAATGFLRGRLLRPFLASDPLLVLSPSDGILSRYALRCLLIDRPVDAMGQALRVLVRPVVQGKRFHPPEDWCD